MSKWMESLPEKMLHPTSLVTIMPVMWIASYLFTQNLIGSILLYGWASVLFVSFILLLVKDFHSDWLLMAFLHTLFFSSLFQVLLYISLRMEQLTNLL